VLPVLFARDCYKTDAGWGMARKFLKELSRDLRNLHEWERTANPPTRFVYLSVSRRERVSGLDCRAEGRLANATACRRFPLIPLNAQRCRVDEEYEFQAEGTRNPGCASAISLLLVVSTDET